MALRWRSAAGPSVFAVAAVALLVYDHLNQRVPPLVFWLTLGLIVAVFVRTIDTLRKQSSELEWHEVSAQSDQVTGLENRRKLEADIASVVQGQAGSHVLVIFELDGLQAYNDRSGYTAGDELLRRFALNLVAAVAPLGGTAYRSDGGRFAAFAPAGSSRIGEIVLAATASLRGDDNDLSVARTYGEVAIPEEALDATVALRIAGQRLSAHKQRQHHSARRQAHAVLIAALSARRPDLRDHLRVVAYRAIALGRRLGIGREEIDDTALAAELQDVGLLAVPESVLEKEALSEIERAMVRSHTADGARIIAAAPGLATVARLVRSSAEHFDGSGYPDGLAGEAIPLGSRVIAVAVAFAAMTERRPYREPVRPDEALAELRRNSGTQFDPRVVEALALDLAEEAASVGPPALA
ncbi:MAG TPA: HD domain-containing phosphohydrolase [Solirubrobacterales bacterium]|nr:HD domain-containing phosphohydrolase [Solirubrobacterales bacterium]